MKHLAVLSLFFSGLFALSQNIQVDSQTYTPQELIQNILIHSDCVTNVVVTNVVGGDFNGTDQSYGYFDGSGSGFPFNSGIVLSTGRLQNVPGPNTSLSDDDAPNWVGDNDLEAILNEPNTLNATILEFDFTSIADQINFNYIFASEEYQEGNANTCQYSDLFGFLIRPVSSTQYTNIALVPNTQTPVKVTTVHSGIPGACPPINAAYFGSWNNASAPINFNGQTAVLTATANVVPNETYHVKLVIADEQNYRYDSAVFLQAGSFTAGKNLGPNRLLSTNNPLCENETLTLDASMPGATAFQWYQNGNPLLGETSENYTVTQAGTYEVEILFPSNCTATGTILVEYAPNPLVQNSSITECDMDYDGLTIYTLWDAVSEVTNANPDLAVTAFFLSQADAEQAINPIQNPGSFSNSIPSQVVYARVQSEFGCMAIAEVTLNTSNESITIPDYYACGPDTPDNLTEIDLNAISNSFAGQVPADAVVNYYENETDAFNESNNLTTPYYIDASASQTLIVRITMDNSTCFAMGTVLLQPVLDPVLLPESSTFYCLNSFPETIILNAGVADGNSAQYSYQWALDNTLLSETTENININQPGVYTVTATNTYGCSSSRNITVIPTETASIDTITITGNSITASVSGTGEYEFNIDHGTYQASDTFDAVPMGFHTLYVRDKNGCGVATMAFAIFGFPPYFTPNGDGYNDVWKPKGLVSSAPMKISIFDRYGKLLKQFNPHASGWDGIFNGELLPNDDYWFLATSQDGHKYRGHFALKR